MSRIPSPCETSDDGTDDLMLSLQSDGDAPSRARRYIAEHATEIPTNVLDDALLLVSELVTNAITYGGASITLRLRSRPPCLGIAVADTGETLPAMNPATPEATQIGGRGLLIVEALAADWGVTRHDPPPGKTVWFNLNPSI